MVAGQSFMVCHPGQLPHFIRHAGSKDVRAFKLSTADLDIILFFAEQSLYHLRGGQRWRAVGWVEEQLKQHNNSWSAIINLWPYRLFGPQLTQDLGFVGHGIYMVLAEEYGHWSGENDILAQQPWWNLKSGDHGVQESTEWGWTSKWRVEDGCLKES